MIDSTFASPVNQNPISFGIDIVIHSATKYLGGHSDILAGAVACSAVHMKNIFAVAKSLGGNLSELSIWLLERSIKTLSIRVRQQNENAQALAEYLASHPAIDAVHYPGLESHPDHALAKKQMRGFTGMMSFEIKSTYNRTAFEKALQLIQPVVSLAGVESTITIPAITSHKLLSPEGRAKQGITDQLVRFSVGIEHVEDLKNDLDQALKKQQMKVDILAFGAHPDDVELGCGGSIAKAVSQGKSVGIVDLTRGELGTRGSAAIRDQEAAAAAKVLAVSFRKNLAFRDGFFVNDEAHQMAVIQLIRLHQPKIVLCNAIEDRHIDHGKGSELVSDACFLSGLKKIETREENGNEQDPWRPAHVYHYIQWKEIAPDFVVDISNHIDTKMEAIHAYASQFYDAKSDEPSTPISSKNFLESIRYRAQNLGRLSGVTAAEGFTVERSPLIQDFDHLS